MKQVSNNGLSNKTTVSVISPFAVHSKGYAAYIRELAGDVSIGDFTSATNLDGLKKCDLVIFQFGKDYDSNLESLLHLRDPDNPTKILAILEEADEYVMKVLAQFKIEGIMLLDNVTPEKLNQAIHQIVNEDTVYLDRDLIADLVHYYRAGRFLPNETGVNDLTNKQVQIITLTAQGYTSAEISQIIITSRSNVTQHKTRIIEILGVRNMYMAIIKCLLDRRITLSSLFEESIANPFQ